MAPPGWFRRWVLSPLEVFFAAAVRPRYAWFPLLLLAYGVFKFGHTAVGTEIGLYPLVALLLLVAWLLRVYVNRLGQKGANRRLLILRVFGRDESASLTFGALRNYWQHIGPSFTVVDPSFIRYKYRGQSEERLDAVAEFTAASDVVLMDLRGFSTSNQGCRTEMELIFDSFPVSKIVFLVDTDSDMRGVEAAIRERWESMSKDSPNLSLREPTVKIYQSKDQSANDVKALINVLVSSATRSENARVGRASAALVAQ